MYICTCNFLLLVSIGAVVYFFTGNKDNDDLYLAIPTMQMFYELKKKTIEIVNIRSNITKSGTNYEYYL